MNIKQTFSKDQERAGSVREMVRSDYPLEGHLLSLLPFAAFIYNTEGEIIDYNTKASELCGIVNNNRPKSGARTISFELYDPNGFYLEASPIAASIADGQPRHRVELLLERSDRSRVRVELTTLPVKDEEGRLLALISYLEEASRNPPENYVAHLPGNTSSPGKPRGGGAADASTAKVWEIETKYRNFIQTLPTPLYTTDTQGHITLFNDAAEQLWGRTPVIGSDLWCGSYRMQHPDGSNLPLEESPMAICLKERRPVYGQEILLVRPDGSKRNVLPHPQPLYTDKGGFAGAINMLIDITDQKNTELALRESEKNYRNLAIELERIVEEKTRDLIAKNKELQKSEERYHKMVEEVEDYAIILLDKNGIVQNWNRGAEKIKGYKEEEIVGKSFSTFYLPEDREKGLPQQILKEAGEKGKEVYEGWRMRKDGSRFWGSIVVTALHDDKNQIIGFSKVTRDLTERKLAEDKMKEYTSQLEFQNKELEQFTYAASHDMKEPLRKIHLYNSAIAENASNVLDQRSKEFLNRSVNAARRMTNLIDDLLTYSRTTANVDSFDSVDLNEILEEVKLIHRDELEQSQVAMTAEPLPVISAIPFQMTQLFSNVLSNAIKYKHADRDLLIQVKSAEVKGSRLTQLGAVPYRNYHKISVIDNGVGFEQQHADRIFNIFQRLHTRVGSHGSGIGLAICKRIVQNHHGFITASAKENQGARFDIYLPK